MAWIDTIVIIIVCAVGLVIFYKALKEPLDSIGRLIKRGAGGLFDKVSGGDSGGGEYDVIRYG